MATVRIIAWLVGVALMIAAGVTADTGNPSFYRTGQTRLALAGAGTLIALGSLFLRMPGEKNGGIPGGAAGAGPRPPEA